MVWGEQIGGTIVLPSDVDPDKPDRNFVLIGEEIPNEVASIIAAGLVFYNVPDDPVNSTILYWVFGIDESGVLRVIAMWKQLVSFDVVTGDPIFVYNTVDIFSLNPGVGNDDPPNVQIPPSPNQTLGAWYETEDGLNLSTSKVVALRQTSLQPSPLAGWLRWDDGLYKNLSFTMSVDGMVTVSGLIRYNGGGTTKIVNLVGDFVPKMWAGGSDGARHIINGSVQDTPRTFAVMGDGLYIRGALPAVGQFASVNGVYPSVLAHTTA